MKMANLDAVFDFMFTDPKYADGVNVFLRNLKTFENISFKLIVQTSKIEANEPLYFCDVCAGPGGFSEYVLWRKRYGTCKGFGMTLKSDNDFRLDDFIAGTAEYFEPFYGEFKSIFQ